MFYNLFIDFFSKDGSLLHFAYLLFRSFGALFTSLIFTFLATNKFIKILKSKKRFQPIRREGVLRHITTKSKTPTMGGFIIMLFILFSVLLWSDLSNSFVWIALFTGISFGIMGLIDDLMKVFGKNTKGFKGSIKITIQFLIAGMILLFLQTLDPIYRNNSLIIPFLKTSLNLGALYLPFAMSSIVGSSNAVNITDGLDGLAIVPIMMAGATLGVLSATSGSMVLSDYINVQHIEGIADLAILSASIIGSGLAFLWFNIHPAKIFMGDVGSLMFGAILGIMSIMVKYELFYAIIGMLFVIEAMSVILQVGSYKLFKKRIFKMAPIHHHFEKMGWNEEKVVIRFWIFAVLCAIIGIAGIV